ncbi:MAG: DMT family transporter [Kiritimatiellia bacterium]
MGVALLFTTALIWGCAFLFQKLGGDCVGPFAFTLYRNVLGGLSLLALMALRRRLRFGRVELIGGAWCGLALWFPSMLQQIGIADTSPGTCAFLTANYALIVPVLGLALGKRPNWYVWPGVALALAGTFLICLTGTGEFALGRGEALTLLCAAFYAVQILVVDHFVVKVDVLALSCVQFFTGAVLGLPFLLLPAEAAHLNAADIRAASTAIIYCGILSSGVAYTLQNVGQKLVAPSIAGIILSLESVFGVFFGWLAWTCGWMSTPEEMTPRRLVGYALVFTAILFTQLLDIRRSRS